MKNLQSALLILADPRWWWPISGDLSVSVSAVSGHADICTWWLPSWKWCTHAL